MKKILSILSICLGMLSVQAQDMKSLFVSLPDSVIPLLTKVNREDCVDFLASNMKAEVKNRFGKPSELKKLTADYLLLQTTEHSSIEMKLLPLADSTQVVCLVHTVCGPACDSYIRFYNTNWQELEADRFIRIPSASQFYLPTDTTNLEAYAAARNKADMELIKATLSEQTNEITFTYTTPDYLAKEDREKLSIYIRKEPLIYRWTEGHFNESDQ